MSELHFIYRAQKHKDRNGEKIVFEMKYFALSVLGFFVLQVLWWLCICSLFFLPPTLLSPNMHCVEKYMIIYSSNNTLRMGDADLRF